MREGQVILSDGTFVVKIEDAQHYRLICYVGFVIIKNRELYFREQLKLYYFLFVNLTKVIYWDRTVPSRKGLTTFERWLKNRFFCDPFKDQFDEASEEFKNVGNANIFIDCCAPNVHFHDDETIRSEASQDLIFMTFFQHEQENVLGIMPGFLDQSNHTERLSILNDEQEIFFTRASLG